MTNKDDYDSGYAAGVKDELARCTLVCEAWHTQNYIQSRYGNYGDYDLKLILKLVDLIKEDVTNTIK
jgi:hypothetical protein